MALRASGRIAVYTFGASGACASLGGVLEFGGEIGVIGELS
jgi:hypothetical protein